MEQDGSGEVFLELRAVPVHVGVLWPTAEDARACGRGEIRLAFEPETGFIHNVAFDESLVDYSLRYDNALHFSPYFQAFEDRLARRLVERYELRGVDVVEIGTGSGRFLSLLCELGDNRGTGYDPSHRGASAPFPAGGRVQVVSDYYSERYADRPADLVVCRHVLEHIPDPRALLHGLRRALEARPETVVYFEVPNTYLILRELSIWDIIYEHCGYFVPESLGAMFEACGFEIVDLHETYEGQFVAVEARIAREGSALRGFDPSGVARAVTEFGARFRAKKAEWHDRLRELHGAGKSAVVWGGGAKAVSFLNLLELGDAIQYVVDVNPGKQGSYLAGSGQAIVAPEFLADYRPDIAIAMNPVYLREIRETLASVSPETELVAV